MVGDTLLATVKSVIETTSDSWEYGKFISSVDYGGVLEFIEATLTIYDASVSTSYTVSGLVPIVTSNVYEKDFEFNLSIDALSILNSSLIGYVYEDGDFVPA